ncbi:MAG: hypothetical protein ACYC9L_17270 [Sulfuricaulis sp.]
MESAANGILLLLFLALFITPRKFLGVGVIGAWTFVVFLVSVSAQSQWSAWLPWASGLGSLACFGIWLLRKFEAPEPPSNSSPPESHE